MSQDDISVTPSHYEARLAELLNQRFSLPELKDLCLDLNVDFENIAGSVKKEKAQELTKYFSRREVLDQLVAAIKSARPDVVIELPQGKTSSPLKAETYAYIAHLEIQPIGDPPHSFKQLTAISSLLEDQEPLFAGKSPENSEMEPPDGPHNTGVLIHSLADTQLIMVSFDNSVPLLQRVLRIASEAKASGYALRTGIHSGALPYHEEGEQSIPDEFLNLTRSTMLLGKEGHILATAHVAETLRRDPALKRFIHDATKCEVKYHVRVEIHNIYDEIGGQFGNPAKPNPAAPTQILTVVNLPKELRCAKPQPITLTFAPDIDYAKVVFSFRNTDLQVSCDGLGDDDCTFDYYSAEGNYTKVFDLWAVKAGEEALEPISIRCFDAANELMGPPVRGRVKLRRRTPEPSGLTDVFKIPLWAWDRFICLPRHLKALALLGALVLGGGYAAAKYDLDKEHLLMATHVWPRPYQGDWSDTFSDTDNHLPSPEKWRNLPLEWTLVQQEGRYQNDKALLVHGEQVGLNNLGGPALYDFKVSLRFTMLARQRRISWILRGQNQGDYYLFVLTLPPQDGVKTKIDGSVYRNGKKESQLTTLGDELPYDHPFPENTTLFVDIEVSGANFKHSLKSSLPKSFIIAETGGSGQEPDPQREDALLEKYFDQDDFHITFSDPMKSYRWGYVGFRGLGSDDEMKIEEITITEAFVAPPETSVRKPS